MKKEGISTLNKIKAVFDQNYVDARNRMIPFAEKFANDKYGATRYGTGKKQEEYNCKWTRCFLEKMDEFAKDLKY